MESCHAAGNNRLNLLYSHRYATRDHYCLRQDGRIYGVFPVSRSIFRSLAFFRAAATQLLPPLERYASWSVALARTWTPLRVIQFPLIGGIILGSACSALLLREFRVYFRIPLRQYLSAIIGGMIMGLASRMAPACNIWHLFGGLPILAMQSMLFLAGLLPGAWLGSIILSRVIVRAELPQAAKQC